jgi:hypothetical protein
MIGQLLKRNPRWQTEIDWRLKKDPVFQEIADDYKKVTNALLHWCQSSEPNAEQITADYLELQQVLIAEAVHYLQRRYQSSAIERK